jgi:DNA-binding transcriptional ArsR family regulator
MPTILLSPVAQPNVAAPAALIGDPARAAMLMHLMDGAARGAGELAAIGGVSPQSASGHLRRLVEGGLLVVRRNGRAREYALASAAVATAIEALAALRADAIPQHLRGGARMQALRVARHCYDHLAGELGVALADLLVSRRYVTLGPAAGITPSGERWLAAHFGVDASSLRELRRPLVRTCVDWTERRPHLAGALGAALLERCRAADWVTHGAYPRTLAITRTGRRAFEALGLPMAGAPAQRRQA